MKVNTKEKMITTFKDGSQFITFSDPTGKWVSVFRQQKEHTANAIDDHNKMATYLSKYHGGIDKNINIEK